MNIMTFITLAVGSFVAFYSITVQDCEAHRQRFSAKEYFYRRYQGQPEQTLTIAITSTTTSVKTSTTTSTVTSTLKTTVNPFALSSVVLRTTIVSFTGTHYSNIPVNGMLAVGQTVCVICAVAMPPQGGFGFEVTRTTGVTTVTLVSPVTVGPTSIMTG